MRRTGWNGRKPGLRVRRSFDVRGVRYGVNTYEFRDMGGDQKEGLSLMVTYVTREALVDQMQGQAWEQAPASIMQNQEKRFIECFVENNLEFARKDRKAICARGRSISNRMELSKRVIGKVNKLVAVTRIRHLRH